MMREDEQANSGDLYDDWNDDDLQIVDLETLNETDEDMQQAHAPSWSVPVLQWQHSFTRKRWRTIATACSILLVCLVLATNLHTTLTLLTTVRNGVAARLIKPQPLLEERLPKPVPITPSLVIPLSQNGFSCITSEAWSPDSCLAMQRDVSTTLIVQLASPQYKMLAPDSVSCNCDLMDLSKRLFIRNSLIYILA